MTHSLDALARRAEQRPFYLAHSLAAYAVSHDLDDNALAEILGCPRQDLPRLRLCKAPREDPEGFRTDVQTLADHFGLDWVRLGQIVRIAQALLRLRDQHPGPRGILLAARDTEKPEEPEP